MFDDFDKFEHFSNLNKLLVQLCERIISLVLKKLLANISIP